MTLIKLEDVAAKLEALYDDGTDIDGMIHRGELREALRSLPTDDGWEDIATAKPIEFVDIVLLCRAGKPKSAMPAFWDGQKWRALAIAPMMEYQNPTHWRPLPAPPAC